MLKKNKIKNNFSLLKMKIKSCLIGKKNATKNTEENNNLIS